MKATSENKSGKTPDNKPQGSKSAAGSKSGNMENRDREQENRRTSPDQHMEQGGNIDRKAGETGVGGRQSQSQAAGRGVSAGSSYQEEDEDQGQSWSASSEQNYDQNRQFGRQGQEGQQGTGHGFDPENLARKIKSLVKESSQAPSLNALVESINALPGITATIDNYGQGQQQGFEQQGMSGGRGAKSAESGGMAGKSAGSQGGVLHITVDRSMAETTARYLYDTFSKL